MRIATRLLLVACVALSACATSTKPGAVGIDRSQLLIVSADVVNEKAAAAYSSTASKARKDGTLNRDAAVTERVRGISKKLISQVGIFRPDAVSWKWEVNVVDSDELNAFCMPGGKIIVYTGIIQRLNLTDAELAAVLGHEIAHALREHSREKVSQSQLSSAIVQGIAASGHQYAGLHSAVANLGSTLFYKLPYSREMESEADVMGLELMARAGYDPSAASGVWKKMQLVGQGGGIEFLSTHPNSETRIVVLEASVPKVLALYKPSDEVPTPLTAAGPQSPQGVTKPQEPAKAAKAYPRGESSLQIERLAKAAGCNESPHGGLVESGPGFERYEVTCTSGTPMTFRCEFRSCKPA